MTRNGAARYFARGRGFGLFGTSATTGEDGSDSGTRFITVDKAHPLLLAAASAAVKSVAALAS